MSAHEDTAEALARALPPRARRRGGRVWGAVSAILAVTVGLGYLVRTPYLSIAPGPATNMLERIQAAGASTYPSKGKLLLVTVSLSNRTLSFWEMFVVWIDPSLTLVERRVVRGGSCVTDQEQAEQHVAEIEGSKLEAEIAAFGELGRPVERRPGARVLTVSEQSPAGGKLRRRDVIVSVDGKPTPDTGAVTRAIRGRRIGDPVRITVVRDGDPVTVTLRTRASGGCPGQERHPVVGIRMTEDYRFPYELEIDTAQVGGPSGGLVFAIAIVDAFTPEDLTGGHVVAATGEIAVGDDGVARVMPIGGVAEKIVSALHVGADVFLVPRDEEAEARAHAPPRLRVIGVSTLREALDALRALPPRR